MLKKGMNKGEVFEMGGRMYRVDEVLPNGNYISTAIKPEEDVIYEDPAVPDPEPTPEPEATPEPESEQKAKRTKK